MSDTIPYQCPFCHFTTYSDAGDRFYCPDCEDRGMHVVMTPKPQLAPTPAPEEESS